MTPRMRNRGRKFKMQRQKLRMRKPLKRRLKKRSRKPKLLLRLKRSRLSKVLQQLRKILLLPPKSKSRSKRQSLLLSHSRLMLNHRLLQHHQSQFPRRSRKRLSASQLKRRLCIRLLHHQLPRRPSLRHHLLQPQRGNPSLFLHQRLLTRRSLLHPNL